MRSNLLKIAGMIAMLTAASPALAHPKLVASNPAPNAVVKATTSVQLTFSERLVPQFSGVDVAMTNMPGMKMSAPAKMQARSAIGADRKSIVLTFGKPLPRGTYKVDWHVVSADTHRVNGSYVFKVA